jgi:hypothetical protein
VTPGEFSRKYVFGEICFRGNLLSGKFVFEEICFRGNGLRCNGPRGSVIRGNVTREMVRGEMKILGVVRVPKKHPSATLCLFEYVVHTVCEEKQN